jgi:hypothetical protein
LLHGCRTAASDGLGPCSLFLWFCLQIAMKRKWTRGDSNPWPPPCEGGLGLSPSFADVLKSACLSQIVEPRVCSCSSTFTPVTVSVTVKRCLHRGRPRVLHIEPVLRVDTTFTEVPSRNRLEAPQKLHSRLVRESNGANKRHLAVPGAMRHTLSRASRDFPDRFEVVFLIVVELGLLGRSQ